MPAFIVYTLNKFTGFFYFVDGVPFEFFTLELFSAEDAGGFLRDSGFCSAEFKTIFGVSFLV